MNILIVDDEPAQRVILSGYLRKKQHHVIEADSVAGAVEQFKGNPVDVVITDFQMPGGTGIDLLRTLKGLHPQLAVILLTAFGTVERAVAAMREGAFSYLLKPLNLDELDILLAHISELHRLTSENQILRDQLAEKFSFTGIISQSGIMEGVLNTAARVAQSSASVLLRGESGTGKELVAKAIHYASERKDLPFIAVNCAALNDNLLESELFGHEKGAFTGADHLRQGRFELANRGTIFLDEIGDISQATQVRLLRVLQEHTFERVGGNQTIEVDVRVIAATHKNLEEGIRNGNFREDLYYRLNVITVDIPPLRRRKEDIPLLLEHFLTKYSTEGKKPGFSKEAWDILARYDYPGNVRELENIVQRGIILSRGEYITREELPLPLRSPQPEPAQSAKPTNLLDAVDLLEKDMVFEALRLTGNNQSKAAQQLGISERNLRYKLKKWGVK